MFGWIPNVPPIGGTVENQKLNFSHSALIPRNLELVPNILWMIVDQQWLGLAERFQLV